MGFQIDINCDMGESFGNYVLGNDAELLNYVSSANIACGFHAGDPLVMAKTVQLAVEKGVAIGAHPSYPDLQGFGRRKMDMTPDEIEALIIYQIGALDGFVRAAGASLTHVKAHGMLYNVAAVEPAIAKAYARAVARYNPALAFVCLATGPMMIEEGRKAGLRVVREAFADRAYNADGSLVSRRLVGSLITDPEKSAEQVIRMVKQGEVVAMDGTVLKLEADTVCVHGDGPTAPAIARALKERLQQEGFKFRCLSGKVSRSKMTLIAPLSTGKILDGAKVELRPMGDRAILLRLTLPSGLASSAGLNPAQRYDRMLAARLMAVYLQDNLPVEPGWPLEFVPGYDNVLAPFDPDFISRQTFCEWMARHLEVVIAGWESGGLADAGSPRLHRLPVVYGGKRGPDLEKVAQRHRLSPEEVIKIHSSTEYSVYLAGFAPGFAYLGALPPAIDMPRLEKPRPSIPGGTVALAAGLTGIYPLAYQPGGWHLIGYTTFALFDAAQDPPVRFLPGDRVQFYPVEEADLPGLAARQTSLAPVEGKV